MPRHARATCVHVLIQDAPPGGVCATQYNVFDPLCRGGPTGPCHLRWHAHVLTSMLVPRYPLLASGLLGHGCATSRDLYVGVAPDLCVSGRCPIL